MLKIDWKEIVLESCWVAPKASRGERDLQAPTEGHARPARPLEGFWFPVALPDTSQPGLKRAKSPCLTGCSGGRALRALATGGGTAEKGRKVSWYREQRAHYWQFWETFQASAEGSPGSTQKLSAGFVPISFPILRVGSQPRSR